MAHLVSMEKLEKPRKEPRKGRALPQSDSLPVFLIIKSRR